MTTVPWSDPSLADIIKMVHPKPASKSREALFGYLIGREFDAGGTASCVGSRSHVIRRASGADRAVQEADGRCR